MKHKLAKLLCALLILAALLTVTACGSNSSGNEQTPPPSENTSNDNQEQQENPPEPTPEPVEKNGDIVILFTSDVHCGVDQGFGYAGLQAVRDYLIAQGNDVILVDDGDNIQGEPLGTMTKGAAQGRVCLKPSLVMAAPAEV